MLSNLVFNAANWAVVSACAVCRAVIAAVMDVKSGVVGVGVGVGVVPVPGSVVVEGVNPISEYSLLLDP